MCWISLFAKDEASESRMRAAGLVEEVLRLIDRRSGLYNVYMDAISKFKSSKDTTSFANARKKLDTDYRSIGNQITQLQTALAKEQSEAVEKVGFSVFQCCRKLGFMRLKRINFISVIWLAITLVFGLSLTTVLCQVVQSSTSANPGLKNPT